MKKFIVQGIITISDEVSHRFTALLGNPVDLTISASFNSYRVQFPMLDTVAGIEGVEIDSVNGLDKVAVMFSIPASSLKEGTKDNEDVYIESVVNRFFSRRGLQLDFSVVVIKAVDSLSEEN